jgi:hypothetical protein
MSELKLSNVGWTSESTFVKPSPFSKEKLDELVLTALDVLKADGLSSDGFIFQNADILFNYALRFVLPNGTQVEMTGKHVSVVIQNSGENVRLLTDRVEKLYSLFLNRSFSNHAIRLVAHGSFIGGDPKVKDLSAFQDVTRGIEFLGKIAHIRVSDWADAIRFEVDRSLVPQQDIFMDWRSSFAGDLSREVLAQVLEKFYQTAQISELNVSPL